MLKKWDELYQLGMNFEVRSKEPSIKDKWEGREGDKEKLSANSSM